MSFVATAPAVPNPWARILGALEKKVNRQSFDTWLKPTRFSHITGRMLFVRVPTPEFQHIGDRYGDLIQEAIDAFHLEFDDAVGKTMHVLIAIPDDADFIACSRFESLCPHY